MNPIVIVLFSASGFDRAAQGVAGEGRRFADALGGQLHAVLIGLPSDELVRAIGLVADAITLADAPALSEYRPEVCLQALVQICRDLSPRAILFGNDTYSQELVPRLAHRLGGSSVGDGLEIRIDGDAFCVRRSVYGGKAEALIRLMRAPAVIWIRARAFASAAPRAEGNAPVTHAVLDAPTAGGPRVVERMVAAATESRLEDARVIVSGGRGIGGPEPFKELQEIAALIGGQVAASRAACDAGWVPPSWQVGQTGKKVAPGLYLAIAIHGASQHLVGISDAKVIAAINIDPDAPIFKHCSFGIVEDYRKVIPLLREQLASRQQ